MIKMEKPLVCAVCLLVFLATECVAADSRGKTQRKDYSYGYWMNAWRKPSEDLSPNILCIETGYYGFTLDVGDLTNSCFGLLSDNADYERAVVAGNQRLKALPPAELRVELDVEGKTYRMVRGHTASAKDGTKRAKVRMWESGKIAQHYDVLDPIFTDLEGNILGCLGSLDIMAWPKSLTFNVELTPSIVSTNGPVWKDVKMRASLKSGQSYWQAEKSVNGLWKKGEKHGVTLHCNVEGKKVDRAGLSITLKTPAGQTFPVRFDKRRNCYVAEVSSLKRSFTGGYVKITDYDEFDIQLDCAAGASEESVPFLLYFPHPANITGLIPILCHPDGRPTGIPMQLSKNWHSGTYLATYALLPVQPGQNQYRIRIPYGFYGTLPSASHAQLSLVGYGGDQRWDQLALACGGEALTFDVDNCLTSLALCDIRLPLGRKGKKGNPWAWTDAGWGGDWLGIRDSQNKKLTFAGMKTAYLSHGPCLSDVIYKGAYGSSRDVLLDVRIQFPRSDDYARTFQNLKYNFQRELSTTNSHFLMKYGHQFARDSVVSYGNGDGLIAEHRVTANLKKDDLLIPPTQIQGPGPWWFAFPEREGRVTGYISVIIRDYKASFGGNPSKNPYLMARVREISGNKANVNVYLVPPPEVTSFKPGDSVAIDTEWAHLVTTADNYGGPNDAYRKHLEESPRSWKTTYREAKGNDLKVDVDGGRLLQKLPIVIMAEKQDVSLKIQGGVGYVPIRFEGLKTADGYAIYEVVNGEEKPLDQSVHGNDFWQTDYDAGANTYKMTFNLPLDGRAASQWILKGGEHAAHAEIGN